MSKVSKVDKHLKAVSEISRAITSNLYLEDILRLIVTVTAEVMNSKICSLLLLDENKKELVIRATQSISDDYNRKPNIKLGEGIAGRVAIDKIPMVISDVRTNPNYLNRDVAKKEGLVSLLAVPMLVKGKIIEEELAERKLVEKAKSLLIKNLGMSEEDAYKKIQRRSMDSRKSMKDVAEAIILASDF